MIKRAREGLGATSGTDQQVFKVLFTVALVAVVWYAFKGRSRITKQTVSRVGRAFGAARQAMADSAEARKAEGRKEAEQRPAPKSATPVPLKPCPRCGTYIAVGTVCICTKS